MKKFGLFFCLSALLALAACNSDDTDDAVTDVQLAKPEVAISTITESMFKVVWDAVPNAEGYKYQLAQESETGEEIPVIAEQTTSATALSFDNLEQETKYILRVKAFATNGLADSEYCKIFATTLAEIREPLTFSSITVGEITYESAKVELVPDALDLYYFTVMENSAYEGKSESEIVAALQSNISASSLVSGKQTKTFNGLKAETNYQVVAFGWDADSKKLTSKISNQPFKTVADTRMSIKITVGTPTDQNVSITFTPSDSAAPYFADVVESTEVAGKGELEIVALLQSKYGKEMTDIMHTGNYSNDYAIESGKSYVAVAFAYDTTTSELTSAMASESFSAGLADGNSIFTITLSNPTESSFDFAITTTDSEMYYTEMAVPVANLSSFNEEKETAGLISLINEYCQEYAAQGGFDFVASNMLDKGNVTSTFSNLKSETEYKLLVIGIAKVSDTEAKACTTFARSEGSISTTAPAPAADDVWVDMEAIYGTFQDGSYAMGVQLYPNEQAKSVWTNTLGLTGDATSLEQLGTSESELRSMLLSEGEEIKLKEGSYQATYKVTPNQVLLITALGKNADGVAGEINWMILKAGSSIGAEPTILGQSEKNESGGSSGGDIELVSATYADYLGDWTLTSAGRYTISDQGISGSEEPVIFNLRIEENTKDQDYKVYGWSSDTEFANAHPFIMKYDSTEESGISGWANIDLAQVLYTEGNIEWTLCPRFIADQSYYYYSEQNLSPAFLGAKLSDGSALIIGNIFEFTDETGTTSFEATMAAMSIMGIDTTDPKKVQTLANETIHAVQPFYLTKAGATTTGKRLSSRSLTNIKRVAATHQTFARFSKASTFGNPYKKLCEQVESMPIIFEGPTQKIEQPSFKQETGNGIKINLHVNELR